MQRSLRILVIEQNPETGEIYVEVNLTLFRKPEASTAKKRTARRSIARSVSPRRSGRLLFEWQKIVKQILRFLFTVALYLAIIHYSLSFLPWLAHLLGISLGTGETALLIDNLIDLSRRR